MDGPNIQFVYYSGLILRKNDSSDSKEKYGLKKTSHK